MGKRVQTIDYASNYARAGREFTGRAVKLFGPAKVVRKRPQNFHIEIMSGYCCRRGQRAAQCASLGSHCVGLQEPSSSLDWR